MYTNNLWLLYIDQKHYVVNSKKTFEYLIRINTYYCSKSLIQKVTDKRELTG